MLNKQGKDKIDWTDFTFNPISGRCEHNCSYCYMHSIWKRFPDHAKLQIKENYFNINLDKKPPSKIFIGSSTDMWGDWVDEDWISRVLSFVENNDKHTFQFLTKNPNRYADFDLPDNAWYGTTEDGTHKTLENHKILLKHVSQNNIRFVSYEPLIEKPLLSSEFYDLNWIIVGADSSKGAKKPPEKWASFLINEARQTNTKVFIKDNYNYPDIIKEFPK